MRGGGGRVPYRTPPETASMDTEVAQQVAPGPGRSHLLAPNLTPPPPHCRVCNVSLHYNTDAAQAATIGRP